MTSKNGNGFLAAKIKYSKKQKRQSQAASNGNECCSEVQTPKIKELSKNRRRNHLRAKKRKEEFDINDDGRRISQADIETLAWESKLSAIKKWVDERVISYYMLMLQRRSERNDLPSVYATDVEFVERICRKPTETAKPRHNINDPDDSYMLSIRMRKEIFKKNIREIASKHDVILMPVYEKFIGHYAWFGYPIKLSVTIIPRI